MKRTSKLATGIGCLALVASMSTSPAMAASGVPDDPTEMVLVSSEPATFTYYDETIGAEITAVGIESTYVDEVTANIAQRSSDEAGTIAGGCAITTFMSNVGRSQSSTTPYYIYATGSAYAEASSGCTTSASVGISLRIDRFLTQPVVSSGSARAYPGTQRYTSVSHRCEAGASYFMTGSTDPYTTPRRTVC